MRALMPLPTRSAPASFGRRRTNRNARGFSLVELMVAIAIGMIITLALGLLMTENMNARANLQQKGERLENGRFALDVLGNDLALAGYFGGYWPFYKDRVFASGTGWHWEYRETASATWSPFTLCPAAPFGWDPDVPRVPPPIMGIANARDTLTSGNAPCLWVDENGDGLDADELELQSNSDIVVVNRVSTTNPPAIASQSVASSSATSSDDFYLQVSDCYGAQESGQAYDTVPFRLSALPVAPISALKRGDCASPAFARKYISHVYYVACMPNCADPKYIPTLRRVELYRDGGKYRRSVQLVPGIERLKAQFGEDSANGDGIMDGDFNPAGGVGNWTNVVTARVFVVARDLNEVATPKGFIDTRSFFWPESGALVASAPPASNPAAKYKRQAFTTVVNLANISGRRE